MPDDQELPIEILGTVLESAPSEVMLAILAELRAIHSLLQHWEDSGMPNPRPFT